MHGTQIIDTIEKEEDNVRSLLIDKLNKIGFVTGLVGML